MARPKSDSREKILGVAQLLLCRQGYKGTGLAQIIEESGAPRGSVYYLFPGGKEEIAVEATRIATADSVAFIDATCQAGPTARQWITAMFENCSRELQDSGFAEGMPLTTVTLDSVPGSPALSAVCREGYESLVQALQKGLEGYGVSSTEQSRGLATLLLSAWEGATILARAQQSLDPFQEILPHVLSLLPE
ncbi:TetR/AcrR family transcriptional regulator [Streptomyces sp. NPDC005808]|uniref:TetR/AcrR family transcriptional regulator n=1 Tax=Streptomyces sp. NPDC005808 TaxID=3364734 RepID=UPI0036AD7F63